MALGRTAFGQREAVLLFGGRYSLPSLLRGLQVSAVVSRVLECTCWLSLGLLS